MPAAMDHRLDGDPIELAGDVDQRPRHGRMDAGEQDAGADADARQLVPALRPQEQAENRAVGEAADVDTLVVDGELAAHRDQYGVEELQIAIPELPRLLLPSR